MAYGLEITGQNGSYQINSDTTQTEYLSVISSGQVTASLTSRATITASVPDIVFVNKTSVANSDGAAGHLRNGYNTVGGTANYVVARKTASLGTFTGTYGLQVKNSNGTLIFDSRGITEGINIIDVKTQGTVGGGFAASGGGPSDDGQSGTSTLVYSGNPTGIYVSTYGAAANSTTSQTGSSYYMQYHFDYVNNEIRLMNSIQFMGSLSSWDNWSMILIGQLAT